MSILTRPCAEPVRLLLTARQAADALAVSERTLWELTAADELPVIRLPGRGKARSLRYVVDDLRQWIARTKANQASRQDAGDRENEGEIPGEGDGGA